MTLRHRLTYTTLIALFAAISAYATVETGWVLVADGKETMPMDSVICLVASDASDRMLVVGTHWTIDDVTRVWFEEAEMTVIHNVRQQQSNTDINIISANNTLFVNGLNGDTNMQIFTTDGQLVHTIYLTPTDGTAKVFIGNLTPAIYILKIANCSVRILKK